MNKDNPEKVSISEALRIKQELMSKYYENHNLNERAKDLGEKWARRNLVTIMYEYGWPEDKLTLYGRERSLVCYFHINGCSGIAKPNLSLYLIDGKVSACDNCVNNYLNDYIRNVAYGYAISEVMKKNAS